MDFWFIIDWFVFFMAAGGRPVCKGLMILIGPADQGADNKSCHPFGRQQFFCQGLTIFLRLSGSILGEVVIIWTDFTFPGFTLASTKFFGSDLGLWHYNMVFGALGFLRFLRNWVWGFSFGQDSGVLKEFGFRGFSIRLLGSCWFFLGCWPI